MHRQTSRYPLEIFCHLPLKNKIVPPADATNVYNIVDEKRILSGVFYLFAVTLWRPTRYTLHNFSPFATHCPSSLSAFV
jgi:hypothetical protein